MATAKSPKSHPSKINNRSRSVDKKNQVLRYTKKKYCKDENIANNMCRPFQLSNRSYEEQVYGIVRRILNKLMPNNLDESAMQIKDIEIHDSQALRRIVYLVFERAINEPYFPNMLALLCKELVDIQCPSKTNTNNEVKQLNFKYLLLKECQLEMKQMSVNMHKRNTIEQDIIECMYPEEKQSLKLKLEKFDHQFKGEYVRFFRFVGGLFKQYIISANVILEYLDILLHIENEISLECFCILLTMIGEVLEKGCNRNLRKYFNTIQECVDNKHGVIGKRIKYMLQDLITLRTPKCLPWRSEMDSKTLDLLLKEIILKKSETLEANWRTFSNYESKTNLLIEYFSPENLKRRWFSLMLLATSVSLATVINLIYEKMLERYCPKIWCKEINVHDFPTVQNKQITELLATEIEKQFNNYITKYVPYITQKMCKKDMVKEEVNLQIEYNKKRIHFRTVRNIMFIGEFFKKNFINKTFVMKVIKELLQNNNDVNLDCLCVLLVMTGKKLEVEESESLADICDQIETIANDGKLMISTKIRRKLKDLIYLRIPKWINNKKIRCTASRENLEECAQSHRCKKRRNSEG